MKLIVPYWHGGEKKKYHQLVVDTYVYKLWQGLGRRTGIYGGSGKLSMVLVSYMC